MTTTPVAVVVRCHNQGAYLAEAISSLQGQTRPPAEVVIVDDASSDESRSVAESLAALDPRIRLIAEPVGLGAAAAFNRGAAATTAGRLIALDAMPTTGFPRDISSSPARLSTGGTTSHGAASSASARSQADVRLLTSIRARSRSRTTCTCRFCSHDGSSNAPAGFGSSSDHSGSRIGSSGCRQSMPGPEGHRLKVAGSSTGGTRGDREIR
jgi:hypothetical protein